MSSQHTYIHSINSSFYYSSTRRTKRSRNINLSKKVLSLKGVFVKNERGYRRNAKNMRFWSLLILLLSVASIRRNLLKTIHTEEWSAHKIQKVVTFNSDRKIINLIPNKNHSDITTNNLRLFFHSFVDS